jgi:hypothetical protein
MTPERFRKQLVKLSPQRRKRRWRDNPALMKFLAELCMRIVNCHMCRRLSALQSDAMDLGSEIMDWDCEAGKNLHEGNLRATEAVGRYARSFFRKVPLRSL